MMTVREELVAIAAEQGIEPEILIRWRLDEQLSGLSDRYRALAAAVTLRLPAGWDSHAYWTVEEGEIEDPGGRVFGGAAQTARKTKAAGKTQRYQTWTVRLCPSTLGWLSDAAVRGVIVHELAHVASGLPSDPRSGNETLDEDRAEAIARWWGFEEERKARLAEDRAFMDEMDELLEDEWT